MRTFKLLIFGTLLLLCGSMTAQVTSVDYQLKYDTTECQYDAFIIINAGTATTIPQRIQFNAQYSIVVPTGTALSVTDSYMPLQSNATYTGTVPLTWTAGTPIIAPASQPESDFYSITPDLGVTSHYNNLAAGDTVKIFSIAVDTVYDCSQGIRIYENGVDPDSDAAGMGMADFSNGFTLGSIAQIYSANSTQLYPPEPLIVGITNACSDGVEIDLTAETSTCQGPLTYAWTGPDGYTGTTEDVDITPALPANNGIYEVVITDAFGCKDSITIDATSKPDAGPDSTVCAGSTIILYGTSPTTGTWAQSASNVFGASLSPLPGGATSVTISNFAGSNTYDMVYSIPGCSDTMQITVNPAPFVNVAASQICENAQTIAASDIPGGTWVSNNLTIATIDANTGVITGEGSGVATFTYTTPAGCTATTATLTVNPGPTVSVTGGSEICVGGFTFVNPNTGGTWASVDPSIATVTNAGVVEGISAGTVALIFTDTFTGCSSDSLFIDVTALPVTAFTGSDSICVNGTTSLTPAAGGTWVSSHPLVASIDNSGNVTGLMVGTAVFTYTNTTTGCASLPSDTLWVLDDPTVAFSGDDRLCIGETSQVTPNSGGTWISNNTTVATIIAATGVITAQAQGIATFTFTDATTGCTATTSGLIVDPVPTASSDFDSICITSTALLNPTTGGTWVALNSGIASLVGNTVTGVSSGDAGFLFTADATGCVSDTVFINVDSGPMTNLTGPNQICIGSTTTIEPTSGGTWSSTNPTIASIDNFGNITGLDAGVAQFIFTSASTLCASDPSAPVQVTPAPIVTEPATELCITETMNLSPAFGGTWVSSNSAIATVNMFTGLVTAVSDGEVTFTFTVIATGCSATTNPITINEVPDVVFTAPDEICVGFTTNVTPNSGGTWVSSNSGVATVDNGGNVLGISAGTADLTYTDTNTGCSSETLTVTILAATPVSITGDDELCVDETSALSPTTGGVWVSNNTAVATVDNSGNVLAVGPGQTTFTFTADAGSCTSTDTDPIVVSAPQTIVLGDTELCIGETTTATTTAVGTWVSTTPAVASIDLNTGVITALTAGTTTFIFTNTATTCSSDESAELTVTAVPIVTLTGPDEICVGETTQLFPSIGGVWTSSNPAIASVENSGLVTAESAGGPVTFTWTDNVTGCTSDDSAPVTVTPGPTTTVNDPELCIGETTQLLPASGGTWVSANTSIATITPGGLVQGVGAGVTEFTFTSSTTGCSSEPTDPITVHGYITTVIAGDAIICVGGFSQMNPSSGGTWTSSNTAVATINATTGFVTGIATGSATFTFTPDATGCPSLPSDPIEVSPAPNAEVTGLTELCVGSTTTLSPTVGGTWSSSDDRVATVNGAGIVSAHGVGVVTFTFTETASGCASASATDPVTITNCLDPDFNATYVNISVDGDVNTNDEVTVGTTYGPTPVLTSKPSGSVEVLTLNANGTYTFTADAVGVYVYDVPACIPPLTTGCQTATLTITVVDYLEPDLRPIANLDIGTTELNTAITLISLENDRCVVTNGCALDATSVSIVTPPTQGGTTSINGTTGDITYTPPANYVGNDTLIYQVCVDGDLANCDVAEQIITILSPSAVNSTIAADDFTSTQQSTPVTGNVSTNDSDAEGDNQTVTAQVTSVAAGTLTLLSNGDYTFEPSETFFGPVDFPYTTCDDNATVACADATLHILVVRDLTIRVRVYLEGALLNSNDIGTTHTRPLMRDNLRSSTFTAARYIPNTDPYGAMSVSSWEAGNEKYDHVQTGLISKFTYVADPTTVFGVTGEDAITDWVFVELRSKSDNTSILATRSGLVQRDGDVVELDGDFGLRFPGIDVDDYYVVIRHRNHLGAMTAAPQTPTQLADLVDFTQTSTGIFDFGTTKFGGSYDYSYTDAAQGIYGLAQNALIKPGYLALWGGDFDGNGKIKYTNPEDDINSLFSNVIGYEIVPGLEYNFFTNFDFAFGYQEGDFDLNSKAKYDNPNDDLNMNYGQLLFYPLNAQFLSNFDFFIEQVPE